MLGVTTPVIYNIGITLWELRIHSDVYLMQLVLHVYIYFKFLIFNLSIT